MTFLVVIVLVFILFLTGVLVWFVYINDANPKLVELLVPVLGSLLLSGFWVSQKILAESDKNFTDSSAVVNFEYISGGQLPIFNSLKTDRPFELNQYVAYSKYIHLWNANFLNKRDQTNFEEFYKNDHIYSEFFEYFVLKTLSEQFSLGWNYQPTQVFEAPYGASGNYSYGVENKFLDKIFLIEKLDLKSQPNQFISIDSEKYYQISVPKNSIIEVSRNENGLTLIFKNPRFDYAISFSRSGAMFNAWAFRDDATYPFYERLINKFSGFGLIRTPEDLRLRTFNISASFIQRPHYRYSEQAELDALFAKNVWEFFDKNYSWRNLKSLYQKVAFEN